MGKTISIGAQSFEFIRMNDCFFVDKTGFIREWWENKDVVTLIARPRRFGKTLNLDMMNCFFSKKYEGRGELFEGLSIWKEEKYRKLQGSYPVIFLSFADIKGETFEETKQAIKYTLEKLYRNHNYVKNGKGMDEKDLAFFDSVSSGMSDDVAVLALKYLSDYLAGYYGQKVLILLDEYDTPLQEAYVYGYFREGNEPSESLLSFGDCTRPGTSGDGWRDLVNFIRRMFNSTFKTNPNMERAIMTGTARPALSGVTRVSRESIFSDLNNLTVVTTTSEKYRTQFGFTEEEVFQALELFGMWEQKEEVKRWYDGFTFGRRRLCSINWTRMKRQSGACFWPAGI